MDYSTTMEETIAGLPCEIWLGITQNFNPSQPHNVGCFIRIIGADILLASEYKLGEMLVLEEDMKDPLDREIAFASAEHLVGLDSLRKQAYNKIRKLENMYADIFGVHYNV